MNLFDWWGYFHENGTAQVKRYYDQADLKEARESDFVTSVHGPFKVKNRQAALMHMETLR